MVNKKRLHWSVKVVPLIGVTAMIIFYYLYGGAMLLRYMLGAVIFASFTLPFVVGYIKQIKNKKVGF